MAGVGGAILGVGDAISAIQKDLTSRPYASLPATDGAGKDEVERSWGHVRMPGHMPDISWEGISPGGSAQREPRELPITRKEAPREPPKDETARATELDEALAKQDKLRSRLEAEASVGVIAALIGSFALSLIPEAKEMGTSGRWWFVLCMATSGSLCLLTVITTGTIYWAGTHLMSATKKSVREENDVFRKFWKLFVMRAARTGSRRAFQLSVPLFLVGITCMVQEYTTDEEDDGAISSVAVLCGLIFAVTLAFGAVMTRSIEEYTTSVTATA